MDCQQHQLDVRPRAWLPRADLLASLALVGAGVAVLATLLPFEGALPVMVAGGLYAAVAAVVLARFAAHRPGRFGLANVVTVVRAGGVAVFAGVAAEPALIAAPGPAWAALGAALAMLALDGIDGWLARRQGLASRFGARFDMEVDALFILVLALLALGRGEVGAWVLGLGLVRYGFLAAGIALPWLARPLPASLRRKAVCVVQITALIALLAPPVAPPLSGAVAATAFAALLWSFAVDIRWLAARRGP